MTRPFDPTARLLGCEVLRLLAAASEAWSQGELEAAERISAAAWRLVGHGQLVDHDGPGEDVRRQRGRR